VAAGFPTTQPAQGLQFGAGSSVTGPGGTALGFNAHAGSDSVAVGTNAFAAGPDDTAVGFSANVTANHGSAFGANASVAAAGGTAIGAGATVVAGATNAVAIGANSIATDPNSVSFGSPGNTRRLENVTAGVNATDAANVGQVQAAQTAAVTQANAYTNSFANGFNRSLRNVSIRADEGTAAAMAANGVPQAFNPGRTLVGVGLGTWGGQAALSIGASHIFESGQVAVKITGSFDTHGSAGVSTGVGWQF
jgi:autotransporter adhesin